MTKRISFCSFAAPDLRSKTACLLIESERILMEYLVSTEISILAGTYDEIISRWWETEINDDGNQGNINEMGNFIS